MKTTFESNRKNVFVYSRWSSAGQADGDSFRRQNSMAEAWCARKGLSITQGESDDGVSAFRGKNRAAGTGLSKLLTLAKPGDYLLVEDCDRLSRQDWLTGMNFVAEILRKGVTVVTLNNGNEIDGERFQRDPGCFLPAIISSNDFTNLPPWPVLEGASNVLSKCQFDIRRNSGRPVKIFFGPTLNPKGGN